MNLDVTILYVYVCIPFQVESGESDDDSMDWSMSGSSSSESDVEVGGTGYYSLEYFLKKWAIQSTMSSMLLPDICCIYSWKF